MRYEEPWKVHHAGVHDSESRRPWTCLRPIITIRETCVGRYIYRKTIPLKRGYATSARSDDDWSSQSIGLYRLTHGTFEGKIRQASAHGKRHIQPLKRSFLQSRNALISLERRLANLIFSLDLTTPSLPSSTGHVKPLHCSGAKSVAHTSIFVLRSRSIIRFRKITCFRFDASTVRVLHYRALRYFFNPVKTMHLSIGCAQECSALDIHPDRKITRTTKPQSTHITTTRLLIPYYGI